MCCSRVDSHSGDAIESSSRNATTSPVEALTPLFRAPETPRPPMFGTAMTSVNSRLISSSSSGLWSTTTMISEAGTVCVFAEATHSFSQSQRAFV
jgi:hypothetical protein